MKILLVAAHPDDEVLGAGGAVARWAAAGHEVDLAILGEGVTSRFASRPAGIEAGDGLLDDLSGAVMQAAKTLGVTSQTRCLGLPDNRFDSLDLLDIVKEVEALVADCQPERILTHHLRDLNVDHRRTAQAVVTATRPQPGEPVRQILAFEVPSSTEWAFGGPAAFAPNYFVDISDSLDKKLDALRAYKSEMRPFPHARSFENVEHLARTRGATVGSQAAEAFQVLRWIE